MQYADVAESLGRNVEPNCIRLAPAQIPPARLNESVVRAGSLSKVENFMFVTENREPETYNNYLWYKYCSCELK